MLASPTLMKTSGILGSSQESDPDTTPTWVYLSMKLKMQCEAIYNWSLHLPFSTTWRGPPESPLHVPCLLGAPSGVAAHISVLNSHLIMMVALWITLLLPFESVCGSIGLIALSVCYYFDISLLQNVRPRARLSPAPSSGDGILTCVGLRCVCWEANWGNVATKGDWGAQSQNCNVIIADMVTGHIPWEGCDFRNGNPFWFRVGSIMLSNINRKNGQGSEISICNNTVGSSENMLSGDESASTITSTVDVQ